MVVRAGYWITQPTVNTGLTMVVLARTVQGERRGLSVQHTASRLHLEQQLHTYPLILSMPH